ncbi:hypothetical protein HQ535_12655 [bacterium]|nr:hypothetical protein [bacterium]
MSEPRVCRRCGARVPTGLECWRCGSKHVGAPRSERTTTARLAGFHPAWVVYPLLVVWLAVRGEMGRGFIVPWFVALTLAFMIRQAGRSEGKSDLEALLRQLLGILQGVLASGSLLALTFGITYRSSGGPDWYTMSHHSPTMGSSNRRPPSAGETAPEGTTLVIAVP